MLTTSPYTLPNNYTYCNEIIDPLMQMLNYYVAQHSKTLVVRIDLHFPQDYPIVSNNTLISNTIAYIVKKYKRQGLDPMYFWVMEQYQSMHHHYHLVLFLDGQKIRSPYHVFNHVEEAWARALGVNVSGCVHHCNITNGVFDQNRNGLQIRRCDGEQKFQAQTQAVINQVSYLAKENTKTFDNDGLRNFGMSRLPN